MSIVDANDPDVWDTDRVWDVRARSGNVNSPLYHTRVKLSYCRHTYGPDGQGRFSGEYRALQLISALSLGVGDKIVCPGDSYGWVAEAFQNLGFNAVPTEISPLCITRGPQTETIFIQERIAVAGITGARAAFALAELDDGGPRARVPVLDEAMNNNGSRNRVRNALGGDPTHIISQNMLPWLNDSECSDVSVDFQNTGAEVSHIVSEFHPGAVKRDGNGDEIPERLPYNNWKWCDQPGRTRANYLDNEAAISARSWKQLLVNDVIVKNGTYRVFR